MNKHTDDLPPITVADLIRHLQTFDPTLPVAIEMYSEHCLLELDHVTTYEGQPPRPDGWVHDKRPDKPTITYLRFPGN